jgi:hypothetical protein
LAFSFSALFWRRRWKGKKFPMARVWCGQLGAFIGRAARVGGS